MNRRDALKSTAAAVALVGSLKGAKIAAAADQTPPTGPFALPPLGYAYEALEPHIDAATMKVHHTGHHQAYVTALNKLVATVPALSSEPLEAVLANLDAVPADSRAGVRNNGGGHLNHTFFWELMTPGGAKAPVGELKSAIDSTFDSTEKLIEAMNKAGATRFGSGWAWLAIGKDKKLAVFSTPNQDTPQLENGSKPVVGVDVWEHAYYLKYQNKRADYLKAWWNTVNWDKAAANFAKAKG